MKIGSSLTPVGRPVHGLPSWPRLPSGVPSLQGFLPPGNSQLLCSTPAPKTEARHKQEQHTLLKGGVGAGGASQSRWPSMEKPLGCVQQGMGTNAQDCRPLLSSWLTSPGPNSSPSLMQGQPLQEPLLSLRSPGPSSGHEIGSATGGMKQQWPETRPRRNPGVPAKRCGEPGP